MGFLVKMAERHNSKVEENKRRKLPDDRILRYKITGTNPKTGRRKTEKAVCGSWEHLPIVAMRTGLEPPFEYKMDLPLTTDAQLDLMKKKRIPSLDGMFRHDASALIQHSIDGVPVFPEKTLPRPILQFFIDRNEVVSSFMTVSDFEDEFLDERPGLRKLIKISK